MKSLIILITLHWCVVDSSPLQYRGITSTTGLPTTEIPTTVPHGCYYNNKFFPPGSVIENGYDPSTNWCYGTECDMYGNIQHWDNFNCVTTVTTTPGTTIPGPVPNAQKTTSGPVPTAHGCFYKGKHYPLGSTIEQGYDSRSNWCYSTFCDTSGHIINADDFNCVKTTMVPPTPAGPVVG